jgi:hypothetical protein
MTASRFSAKFIGMTHIPAAAELGREAIEVLKRSKEPPKEHFERLVCLGWINRRLQVTPLRRRRGARIRRHTARERKRPERPVAPRKAAIRSSAQRCNPYGNESWNDRTIRRLNQESTIRPSRPGERGTGWADKRFVARDTFRALMAAGLLIQQCD